MKPKESSITNGEVLVFFSILELLIGGVKTVLVFFIVELAVMFKLFGPKNFALESMA